MSACFGSGVHLYIIFVVRITAYDCGPSRKFKLVSSLLSLYSCNYETSFIGGSDRPTNIGANTPRWCGVILREFNQLYGM